MAVVHVMTLQSLVLLLMVWPVLGRGYGRPAPLISACFQPALAVRCLIFPCEVFAQLGHARVHLQVEISFGFHISPMRLT